MKIDVQTVAAQVVTPPTTTTITLSGLDAGQVRRFRRIMAHQASGGHYDGPRTNQFAKDVMALL